MLRLTRTAIGLLTAQYRSVLKKCWAINVGIFGLMGKAVADTIQGTLSAFGVNVTDVLSMMRSLDGMLGIQRHPDVEQRGAEGSSDAFGITSFLQNDWILRPWLRMTRKGATLPVALVAATVMATTLTVMPNEAEAASKTGTGVLCYLSDGTVKYESGVDTCTSGTKLATMGAINSSGTVGTYSTALGKNSTASGSSSTALGNSSKASGNSSTALGSGSKAYGAQSSAFGYYAQAGVTDEVANTPRYALAVGTGALAQGKFATAIGTSDNYNISNAYNERTVAFGNAAIAIGKYAVTNIITDASLNYADPYNSSESTYGTTAIGQSAQATGNGSIAFGYSAIAGGYTKSNTNDANGNYIRYITSAANNALAIGTYSNASAGYAVALGYDAYAKGESSTALGYNAQGTGRYSVAIGPSSSASDSYAVAIGGDNVSAVGWGVAIGKKANASGTMGIALGAHSDVSGGYAIALGGYTKADGDFSIAIGEDAKVHGQGSVALGNGTQIGSTSRAITGSVALGDGSVATESNVISVGHKSGDQWKDGTKQYTSALTRRIVNVANGTGDNDAATYGQVKGNITGLTVNGRTITYTKVNGTTGTITTQDNNTTYTNGTGISLSGTTFSLDTTYMGNNYYEKL